MRGRDYEILIDLVLVFIIEQEDVCFAYLHADIMKMWSIFVHPFHTYILLISIGILYNIGKAIMWSVCALAVLRFLN